MIKSIILFLKELREYFWEQIEERYREQNDCSNQKDCMDQYNEHMKKGE